MQRSKFSETEYRSGTDFTSTRPTGSGDLTQSLPRRLHFRKFSKLFLAIAALGLALPALTAQAQYYPPPRTRPSAFYLGKAHVDGRNDHDDIKVGHYEGRFHSVLLQVHNAPILFDHVVIHYGDGASEALPVNRFIPPEGNSQWIVLPGGERVIHSLELWYSRARPEDPNRPEVELYGAP